MCLLALNSGEILREFGEILQKYRILDERSVGSKWLSNSSVWSTSESTSEME